jgi:hypothetical protein
MERRPAAPAMRGTDRPLDSIVAKGVIIDEQPVEAA